MTPVSLRSFSGPEYVTITGAEFRARQRRRERLIRVSVAIAALVLPSLAAWTAVGAYIGALP